MCPSLPPAAAASSGVGGPAVEPLSRVTVPAWLCSSPDEAEEDDDEDEVAEVDAEPPSDNVKDCTETSPPSAAADAACRAPGGAAVQAAGHLENDMMSHQLCE